MTDRFLRDYSLTIGIGSQAVTIAPPFRIAFSATKSDDSSLNKMTLKIYNLSGAKRLRLVRDGDEKKKKSSDKPDTGTKDKEPEGITVSNNKGYFPIELKVGYQGKLETIFRGSIDTAASAREGAEFITSIECLDGGHDFLRGFVSTTVTTKSAAFDAILSTMPNTSRGKIGSATEIIRPKVLVGNSIAVTQEMLDPDQTWFIDNERLNILRPDEVVSSFAPVISAATGLLNTPEAEKTELTLNTMMNPSVKVGGLFRLISVTAPHLNGIYKTKTITYSGDTDGNDWMQQVTGVVAENYQVPQ